MYKQLGVYLSPQLQKPNHLKRLLNIRDLLTKAHRAPLCVHFHKLVLGDHLLEAAEGGFDIFARGDVVGDVVDEGGYGDPAGVCLGFYCARALLDMVSERYVTLYKARMGQNRGGGPGGAG